ncbi:hypothetical protein G3480_16180 [Thiorhodococcus mannitoliphagus]|uniref:Uncharacterized protein n=1 Tax=Thiorhodococcus mannitoliphagus TaxID=329406 RepID=A0A6P1DUR6_9GAMM|nr:hypothetical protein [Thiorhodococcus mannitoliphagus]NEX21828.1 hypothetical protein [Thiorhodococcus mannitoliphagus]
MTTSGLLLEAKSVPRAGHHLLRDLLQAHFGRRMSHCERYLEPGCCRSLPCKLAPIYVAPPNNGIRLTKSHDLELTDPVSAPRPGLITVIQYRHPLWALISNYLLWLSSQVSIRLGIPPEKLNYLHEPALSHHLLGALADQNDLFDEAQWGQLMEEWVGHQQAFYRKWGCGKDFSHIEWDAQKRLLYLPYEVLTSQEGAHCLLTFLRTELGQEPPETMDYPWIRPTGAVLGNRPPWLAEHLRHLLPRFVKAGNRVIQLGLPYPCVPENLTTAALEAHLSDWASQAAQAAGHGTLTTVDAPVVVPTRFEEETLVSLRAAIAQREREIGELRRARDQLAQEAQHLAQAAEISREVVEQLKTRAQTLEETLSWRLTRPLRAVLGVLQRLRS